MGLALHGQEFDGLHQLELMRAGLYRLDILRYSYTNGSC
jgi:hypothetical protein